MPKFAWIAAAFLVIATTTIGRSFFAQSGVGSFLGATPSPQDFVTQVVVGEMFEIELGRLAEQRGNGKTRRFAAQLLKDHKQTSAQLKALVQGGAVKVSYPIALDSVRRKQLDDLKALSGPEFDDRFEAVQSALHEQSISLFERYGTDGEHPDLKRFAYRHLPHLREHWRQARALKE